MAWIIENNDSFTLKLSPSLTFNNLTSSVSSVAYVHKGNVVLCGLDGEVKCTLKNDAGVRALQVLLCSGEDFDFLVIALNTGIQVWSSDGARLIYFFAATPKTDLTGDISSHHTQGIAMVPKGRVFVVGCSDGDVFAFEAKRGSNEEKVELMATLRGHDHPIVCAGADGEYCVTGDAVPVTAVCVREGGVIAAFSTGLLRIFDTRSESLMVEIAAHSRIITAIDLHPTTMLVATVGEDFLLNVWEFPDFNDNSTQSGQVGLVASSRVANRLLTGVRFLVDGSQRIAGTSYDCSTLHLWHKL